MTIQTAIFGVLITLSSLVFSAPTISPKFKNVVLEEYTTLELKILADGGTQLIFPFELDNPELKPTLKIRLTNSTGFEVPTEKRDMDNLIMGQNTITILGKYNESAPGAQYLSNLFINIGGYNLSIALKTTLNVNEHISNIVFNLNESDRVHMVERMVERKTRDLEEDYKKKLETIDKTATDKSLTHIAKIARLSPDNARYKEDGAISIDDSRLVVFADRAVTYGAHYAILMFEIENKSSKDFELDDIQLVSIDESYETAIVGTLDCDQRLLADSTIKCSYATTNTDFPKAPKLKLVVRTNRGQGEFQW